MLSKISIQGFKSLHHIQELELGCINVFIGANGSGKSNLLEAVGMLSAAASGQIDSESLSRRGVRLSVPQLYTTSLKGKTNGQKVRFQADGKWNEVGVEYEILLGSPMLSFSSFAYWTCEEEVLTGNGETVAKNLKGEQILRHPWSSALSHLYGRSELESGFRQLFAHLLDYAIYSPTTPVLRGIQPDMAPRDPLGLLGGRLAEAVEEILDLENETLGDLDLDDVLDLLDWVEEFDITTPSRELLSPDVPSLRSVVRFKDYWMANSRNQLSGYDANEGALYVLFMLILALHPRTPRFFAIDHFDHSLNPRLARALSRLFCQLIVNSDPPRQVLLTTHNPLVLDGLDLRDDRIRLFAVERTRSTGGATQVYRVEVSDEVLDASPGGLSLSNLWLMGRFAHQPPPNPPQY